MIFPAVSQSKRIGTRPKMSNTGVLHLAIEPQGIEVVAHIIVVLYGVPVTLKGMLGTAQAGWTAPRRIAQAELG
jgi:hypothetical protein